MIRLQTDLFGEPLPMPAILRKDGGHRKIGYAARRLVEAAQETKGTTP